MIVECFSSRQAVYDGRKGARSDSVSGKGQSMRQHDLRTRELEDTSREETAPQPRLHPPANRRPGTVGAIVALVVVIVLGGAFFTAISLHRNAQPGAGVTATGVAPAGTATVHMAPTATPSPTPAASPLQPPVHGPGLPAGVEVITFVMTGPGEGWGTGGVNVNPVSGTPASGIVLHYAAGTWTQVGAALPSAYLGGLDMISSSEGWVIGGDESNNQSLLLHISNGAWQKMSLPNDPGAASDVIAMRTPAEGWMAMANLKTATSGANTSLFHYAGGAWSLVQNPLHYITDIAPVADGEAWVVGWNTNGTSSLVRVRGGTATVVLTSPSNSSFSRLRVFAPNDIWIEAAQHDSSNADINDLPLAYHFDGSAWSPVNLQVPEGAQHVGVVSSTSAWSFASVQPAPPNQTAYGQIASIYSNAGGQWKALSVPYKDLQSIEIVSNSSTDVWAIGVYMVTTQEGNESSSYGAYVLLHYTNGTWTEWGR